MTAVANSAESDYLPEGWTFDESPSYVHGIKITSPDNHSFYSRREVIESMMKSKVDNCSIFLVWSSLHKEGWQLGGPLLPPGWRWMKYKRDHKYLTEGMVVFISSSDALKYINGNDDYEMQAAQKFKEWLTIHETSQAHDASSSMISSDKKEQEQNADRSLKNSPNKGKEDTVEHELKRLSRKTGHKKSVPRKSTKKQQD